MEPSPAGASTTGRGAALPFLTLGAAAIVFGGLFSAATARMATYHSAWSVAYVVLVVGVAQVALGLGQWWLASHQLSAGFLAGELVAFNVGNAGVILGTLLGASLWVDAGSALLVIALVCFGWGVRSSRRRGPALWTYWTLIVLLLVSVVIGLIFANIGAP